MQVKWNSDRLVIVAKWFFKLTDLLMLLKEAITSQKHGSNYFGELKIMFSTKINLLYLLYLIDLSLLSSGSDKVKLFA